MSERILTPAEVAKIRDRFNVPCHAVTDDPDSIVALCDALDAARAVVRECFECPALLAIARQYDEGDVMARGTIECKVTGSLARRILFALGETTEEKP